MTTPFPVPADNMVGEYDGRHTPGSRDSNAQKQAADPGRILHHMKTGTWKMFEGGHLFPHALSSAGGGDATNSNPYQNLVPLTYEQNHGPCEDITKEAKNKQGHSFQMSVTIGRESFYITMLQFAQRLGINPAEISPANYNIMLGPIPQHQPSTISATITDNGINSPPFYSQLPDHERPSGNINDGITLMNHIIATGAWTKLTPGMRANISTIPTL